MINKFLHSNLFLLISDLDFDRIQLAERLRVFLKVGSDFIQDTEPFFLFKNSSATSIADIQLYLKDTFK